MISSIIKGIKVLITSGILLKPATIAGIAIAYWLLFLVENEADSYLLAMTAIPYSMMVYSAIVFALFSRNSREYNKLSLKLLLLNILGNFLTSLIAFISFIGFINFISF